MNFIIYCESFREDAGGINILYNLAKNINDAGYQAKIYNPDNPDNIIIGTSYYNKIYYNYATIADVNDKSIIIYPDCIPDNPLHGKIIIRWVLGPNIRANNYADTDIIYYIASMCKNNNIFNKNILMPFYIADDIKNRNEERSGSCYIIKKAHKFYRNIEKLHDTDSECLDYLRLTHKDYIDIFNKKKYFYCYDPLCFLSVMAIMCGCIVIQVPVLKDYTETDWINYGGYGPFLKFKNKECKIKGIAYGLENLKYAKDTIHEAYDEVQELIKFGKSTFTFFLENMKLLTEGLPTKFLNRDKAYVYNDLYNAV